MLLENAQQMHKRDPAMRGTQIEWHEFRIYVRIYAQLIVHVVVEHACGRHI